MNPSPHSSQHGFTLIELVIYIGLVTLLMGGAIATTFQLIRSEQLVNVKTDTYTEGSFLLGKIQWVLGDVATVIAPAPNSSGATLSVSRPGYAYNPIVLTLVGGDVRITEGGNPPIVLNNTFVDVSSLSFQYVRSTGATTVDRITASFFINNERFETTRVLTH